MNLDEFIKLTYKQNDEYPLRPRIRCVDGFSISVQAGKALYCIPRENCDSYLMVEVGYPSEEILIKRDDAVESLPEEEVMGYVPVQEIQNILDKHGGIDEKYVQGVLMMEQLIK